MQEISSLRFSQRLLVGLTLFSMFFGAGNLIFPPFLGVQAGVDMPAALAGFLVTAVGFPILGVMAVAESGGTHGARLPRERALCVSLYAPHLSFDRTLPGNSPHGEHVL